MERRVTTAGEVAGGLEDAKLYLRKVDRCPARSDNSSCRLVYEVPANSEAGAILWACVAGLVVGKKLGKSNGFTM